MAKIKVNDNLTNIFNLINSALKPFPYSELIQYVIDYDLYQEFYLNNVIINRLYDEKMKSLKEGKGDKVEKEIIDSIGKY